jgi:hypothetical protein
MSALDDGSGHEPNVSTSASATTAASVAVVGVECAASQIQADVASQAAPFEMRFRLYFCYLFSAWGDRQWEFASVIFLIDLFGGSLLYASILGLVETTVGILTAPYIGARLDRSDRLQAMIFMVVCQNTIVAAGSLMCVHWLALENLLHFRNHVGQFALFYFFSCGRVLSDSHSPSDKPRSTCRSSGERSPLSFSPPSFRKWPRRASSSPFSKTGSSC